MDDDGEDVIDMMEGEEEWGTMNEADESNEKAEEESSLADLAGGTVSEEENPA